MAPVGPRVVGIAIWTIVIPAWVVRRAVKHRNRNRDRQTEADEDPCLRLGLNQQRKREDHRQKKKNFFHIVTGCRRSEPHFGYEGRIQELQELQEFRSCRIFGIILRYRREVTEYGPFNVLV